MNREQVMHFIDELEGIKAYINSAPVLLESDLIRKIGFVQDAMFRVSPPSPTEEEMKG